MILPVRSLALPTEMQQLEAGSYAHLLRQQPHKAPEYLGLVQLDVELPY